jgi:hypothetical protein
VYVNTSLRDLRDDFSCKIHRQEVP